ncbi:hypothetical protein FisN_8Lh379 [Fistulifera solaris]|uniref:S1 motif domain-containing protein n=1 Tax=Fistulifera solaris TaxID=1519565 RepID=A0A1Z5JNI1_FISSO|nr:hypothetical protein FisN_8Lh379 [Fistulifera solaris]|eukprot:GAX15328.1 hypothetical protein FisN_8Lh379 [Fistulifera solaris]
MGGSGAKRRRQDQRQPSSTTVPTHQEPPTKKSKKPKHLHRKLQQAQDDITQQELIRKAIMELENSKKHKQKQQQGMQKTSSQNDNQRQTNSRGSVPPNRPSTKEKIKETSRQQSTTKKAQPVAEDKPTATKTAASVSFMIDKNNTEHGDKHNSTNVDSDDDDIDIDLEAPARRQRGKRRRGRQPTSEITEESQTSAPAAMTHSTEKVTSSKTNKNKTKDLDAKSREEINNKRDESNSAVIPTTHSEPTKAKRYCHGRKPVTDFVLGQSYPGKVVYVKDFGIFVDINCHIDAFCHVSRLSDEFVASPHDLYKPGDEIPAARIVELERKRITISLQSEKMQEQEQASRQAREERKYLRSRKGARNKETKKVQSTSSDAAKNEKSAGQTELENRPLPMKEPVAAPPVDPANMTPAELKRARKLERRAARRASAEEIVASQ